MDMKLNQIIHAICMKLNNGFVRDMQQEHGEFHLNNGEITLKSDIHVGRWILLTRGVGCFEIINKLPVGDAFNYEVEGADDIDHRWTGIVYEMELPLNFVHMARRVHEWSNSDEAKPTIFTSEKVANFHSWQVASGEDGLPAGWWELFGKDLMSWYQNPLQNGVRW